MSNSFIYWYRFIFVFDKPKFYLDHADWMDLAKERKFPRSIRKVARYFFYIQVNYDMEIKGFILIWLFLPG